MSGLSMPEQGHAEAASDDKTAEKPGVHPPAEQNAQAEAEHAAIVQIPPATHMVPSLPKKLPGRLLSSFCVMKHSMQQDGILNQPPRYALRTSSDFASSAPVPDRVMAPVSST